MNDLRRWLLIGVVILVGGLVATKMRQSVLTPGPLTPESTPQNYSVLLIRGDQDPACQEIYRLVDEAEASYGESIAVMKSDWSADNPWIERYDIRFVPAVVFLDPEGNEIERFVGESSTVRENLKEALASFETVATQ